MLIKVFLNLFINNLPELLITLINTDDNNKIPKLAYNSDNLALFFSSQRDFISIRINILEKTVKNGC